MNTVKISSTEPAVLGPEGPRNPDDGTVQPACGPIVKAPQREMHSPSNGQVQGASLSPRVAIKIRGAIHFIRLGEIVAVQASGNYVSLEQGASTHLLRESFRRVAEMFEPCGFVRIHRSVLINTSFVVQIKPQPETGGYCLRVAGGKEYKVTRKYKKNLKAITDYWIGTGALFLC